MFRLEKQPFSAFQDWQKDDFFASFEVFRRSSLAFLGHKSPLRAAQKVPDDLIACFHAASRSQISNSDQARQFFEAHFEAHHIIPDKDSGFLTGYYEPEVQGSLTRSAEFSCPILARPADLVTLNEAPVHLQGLAAARRQDDASLVPYYTRAEIEAGAANTQPVLFLKDSVEVFLIQVQGSATVTLQDGQRVRLKYAGRNGQPYTSIGKILIEEGHIAAESMSLALLKDWLRHHDLAPGGLAWSILQRNKSYVFFEIDPALEAQAGPTGGEGVSLSPLRSIAIDRSIWPYGLPFWIEAELPWKSFVPESFARLMIAQDTGSAILGPARADLFFGTGPEAGLRAGNIRHNCKMTVLLPKPFGQS